MSININNSNDPFYRYKRDKIEIVYKGNETHILNLHKIARQLCCSPIKDEKYIQSLYKALLRKIKKLGTSVKEIENVTVVKGKIEKSILEDLLNNFIKKYILCPKCSSPEFNTKICSACGYVI